MKKDEKKIIAKATENTYKYGFVSQLETDTIEKGLNADVIKTISKKKKEPSWMLEKRLEAFDVLKNLKQPKWANIKYPEINF